MIELNLLSPQKKSELKLTYLYIGIKNIIIFILYVSIVVAILLLLTKFTLQKNFEKSVNDSSLVTKNSTAFAQNIRNFNIELNAAEKVTKNHIEWSRFIAFLSAQIPQEITLKSLYINSGKIVITGHALSRDKLLLLQENLEKSDYLSNIQNPIENLLKQQDIDFTIKADLKIENISTYGD